MIDSLLAAISSRITLELKVRKKAGAVVSFGSERTAFNDYSTFVRDYVTSHPYRTNKIEPTEQAVLDYINEYEIVLDQSSLTAIFANRIGTQDRITGNKPFLPLGLLTTILPKGAIREWAKNAASHVLIHTSDCNVLVTDVDELTIDTKTQKVTVKLATGETQTVTNPPLNGHKDSMRINMISDTDIDHDPDIHSILIKMKGQLTALDWITSKILRTQESLGFKTINASNCNSIYSVLTSDCNFMDEAKVLQSAIIAELDLVTAHHKLQLASKVWNRSTKKHNKGNGI